jgi:hypothetical protein
MTFLEMRRPERYMTDTAKRDSSSIVEGEGMMPMTSSHSAPLTTCAASMSAKNTTADV